MISCRSDVTWVCALRGIPDYMVEDLARYLFDRCLYSDFLRAVLENKLVEAFIMADDDNRDAMHGWATLMYSDIPYDARGSAEKVRAWLGVPTESPPGLAGGSENPGDVDG